MSRQHRLPRQVEGEILTYLDRLPNDYDVPMVDLCRETGTSEGVVNRALDSLKDSGFIELDELTRWAKVCRITLKGRKVVKDFTVLRRSPKPRRFDLTLDGVEFNQVHNQDERLGSLVSQILQDPANKEVALLILDRDRDGTQYTVHMGARIESFACCIPSQEERGQ